MNMPLAILNRRRKGGAGVGYSNFIPSGSDSLITADSLTFRVRGVVGAPSQITDNMWALVPVAGGLRVDLAPYPDAGDLP
jgi:hypothetical protein